MTDLLKKAVEFTEYLEPQQQDQVAISMLLELSLMEIRACLGTADAELVTRHLFQGLETLRHERLKHNEDTITY